MFEFLKRHKIKNRAALRSSLLDRGHTEIPHHDSAEFDSVLAAIITEEMLSSDLSSHFEPSVDTPSFDTLSSIDPGGDSTVVVACRAVAAPMTAGNRSFQRA
jgi:hypothetical protein